MAIFVEGATRMMLDGAGKDFSFLRHLFSLKTKGIKLCFNSLLCVTHTHTLKIDQMISFSLKKVLKNHFMFPTSYSLCILFL